MRSFLPPIRTISTSFSADWQALKFPRRKQQSSATCRASDSSIDLKKVKIIWLSSQRKGRTKRWKGGWAWVRSWRRRGGRGSWDRGWRSRLIMILRKWLQYKSNFIINFFTPLRSALGSEHWPFVSASLSIQGSCHQAQGLSPLFYQKWRQSCPN